MSRFQSEALSLILSGMCFAVGFHWLYTGGLTLWHCGGMSAIFAVLSLIGGVLAVRDGYHNFRSLGDTVARCHAYFNEGDHVPRARTTIPPPDPLPDGGWHEFTKGDYLVSPQTDYPDEIVSAVLVKGATPAEVDELVERFQEKYPHKAIKVRHLDPAHMFDMLMAIEHRKELGDYVEDA